jgi:uncharacterized protein YdeI (YjbR/CyaY-like superfamily)
MNNSSVDSYLKDGCGRCEHFKTPACKVHLWTPILMSLRRLVLAAGLEEDMKWGSPCYTLKGKNVLMIVSLREACAFSFFKGAAIVDDQGALESPGPNSHHMRYLKFRSLAEFTKRRALATKLVKAAIDLERQGVKTAPSPKSVALPVEFEAELAKNVKLRKAFNALTPGRQRSHILHISGAKQSETRSRRVDKCTADILAGRGFNERE